jgi:hypothetical protein
VPVGDESELGLYDLHDVWNPGTTAQQRQELNNLAGRRGLREPGSCGLRELLLFIYRDGGSLSCLWYHEVLVPGRSIGAGLPYAIVVEGSVIGGDIYDQHLSTHNGVLYPVPADTAVLPFDRCGARPRTTSTSRLTTSLYRSVLAVFEVRAEGEFPLDDIAPSSTLPSTLGAGFPGDDESLGGPDAHAYHNEPVVSSQPDYVDIASDGGVGADPVASQPGHGDLTSDRSVGSDSDSALGASVQLYWDPPIELLPDGDDAGDGTIELTSDGDEGGEEPSEESPSGLTVVSGGFMYRSPYVITLSKLDCLCISYAAIDSHAELASRFLTGDVVGFWMAHLGFAQSTPWTDEVAVVSSDWYALMVKPHNITAGSSSRLAAAAVGYCTRGRRSVWDSKVVVVPVHDDARLHWCLLVIYAADFDGTGPPRNLRFVLYDSLYEGNGTVLALVRPLLPAINLTFNVNERTRDPRHPVRVDWPFYLDDRPRYGLPAADIMSRRYERLCEMPGFCSVELAVAPVARQRNLFDCGLYMLLYLEYVTDEIRGGGTWGEDRDEAKTPANLQMHDAARKRQDIARVMAELCRTHMDTAAASPLHDLRRSRPSTRVLAPIVARIDEWLGCELPVASSVSSALPSDMWRAGARARGAARAERVSAVREEARDRVPHRSTLDLSSSIPKKEGYVRALDKLKPTDFPAQAREQALKLSPSETWVRLLLSKREEHATDVERSFFVKAVPHNATLTEHRDSVCSTELWGYYRFYFGPVDLALLTKYATWLRRKTGASAVEHDARLREQLDVLSRLAFPAAGPARYPPLADTTPEFWAWFVSALEYKLKASAPCVVNGSRYADLTMWAVMAVLTGGTTNEVSGTVMLRMAYQWRTLRGLRRAACTEVGRARITKEVTKTGLDKAPTILALLGSDPPTLEEVLAGEVNGVGPKFAAVMATYAPLPEVAMSPSRPPAALTSVVVDTHLHQLMLDAGFAPVPRGGTTTQRQKAAERFGTPFEETYFAWPEANGLAWTSSSVLSAYGALLVRLQEIELTAEQGFQLQCIANAYGQRFVGRSLHQLLPRRDGTPALPMGLCLAGATSYSPRHLPGRKGGKSGGLSTSSGWGDREVEHYKARCLATRAEAHEAPGGSSERPESSSKRPRVR